MNNPDVYKFYAGKDKNDEAIWSSKFSEIKPLLEWKNNMGCVTGTYNSPLGKYIMAITDGKILVRK